MKPLLAAAICLLLGACAQDSGRTATGQVEALLRKRQSQAALRVADQYLSTHPQAPTMTRLRILVLLKLNRRDQALEALQQLPARDPVWQQALTQRDEDIRIAAARLIADSKELPISYDELLRGLEDPIADVRRYCAYALGHQPAAAAMKPLLGILGDDDWYVRAEAVTALGNIGDTHAVAWIVNVLNDGDAFVRYRALKALECMPREPVRLLLLNHLNKTRGPGNYAIALALAKLEDPTAAPALLRALNSTDYITRRNATVTLADIPANISTNILNTLVQDPDIYVKKAARLSLQKLSSPPPQPLPAPSFIENFELSLSSGS